MLFVKTTSESNGARASCSCPRIVAPTGYITIPFELETHTLSLLPWVTLTIEDGVVTGVSENTAAKEAWKTAQESEQSAAEVQSQISALKVQLSETDYKIIKCSECQLAGLELPYDIAAIHTERQAIRDQINTLESGA